MEIWLDRSCLPPTPLLPLVCYKKVLYNKDMDIFCDFLPALWT